jgi:hypothetical protein
VECRAARPPFFGSLAHFIANQTVTQTSRTAETVTQTSRTAVYHFGYRRLLQANAHYAEVRTHKSNCANTLNFGQSFFPAETACAERERPPGAAGRGCEVWQLLSIGTMIVVLGCLVGSQIHHASFHRRFKGKRKRMARRGRQQCLVRQLTGRNIILYGAQGGSLDPPGPTPMPLYTVYMEYSECTPTLLNPLAERTCFSQKANCPRPAAGWGPLHA